MMDNIAEGFDDTSSKEFIKFLGYALRFCSEVQSQLYRALNCRHIGREEFSKFYELAGNCRRQIKAFRGYFEEQGLRCHAGIVFLVMGGISTETKLSETGKLAKNVVILCFHRQWLPIEQE